MLSQKKQIVLTKLLESKKVKKLRAEIKHKDKIIKNLKALVKHIDKGELR